MLSVLGSLAGILLVAVAGGVLVMLTQKLVTPVLRRLPRSEHLGRPGSSAGAQYGDYTGGYDSSCDSSSSSSSDSGGGTSC